MKFKSHFLCALALSIGLFWSIPTSASAEGIRQNVRFARGATSATIKGAVVRGDNDTYLFSASAGQQFSIQLTSVEDNATFELYNTSEELCDSEVKTASGRLPTTGTYKVVVSPSRGNATYSLKISIR